MTSRPRWCTQRLTVLAVAALCCSITPTAFSQQQQDPWRPIRALVGTWEGTGSGFGTVSDVSHRWEFVIGEHFLRLRTRSVSRAADGTEEVHEDVGYVSYDADRERFVFRQFLSEGYVNTYDVNVLGDDPPAIDFAYRDAESAGGMRAQMRLVFTSPNEYEMVLDLAASGQPFVACQTMTMNRVRENP